MPGACAGQRFEKSWGPNHEIYSRDGRARRRRLSGVGRSRLRPGSRLRRTHVGPVLRAARQHPGAHAPRQLPTGDLPGRRLLSRNISTRSSNTASSPRYSGASSGSWSGVVVALQLAFPDLNIEPWFNFGRVRPAAHLGRDLRLRRQRADRDVLLRRPAHQPRPPVRRQSRLVRLLGLPALHRAGGHRLSPRHHAEPRICRAGMVRRPVADDRLGGLSDRLPRHAHDPQGTAHLCGELVLPVLHRHHRHAAYRQQPGRFRCRSWAPSPTRLSPACRMR